ncbi:MAG: VWA domain-containing protein [Chloroflexi bacterium]|nr:VWA domain-containing protein [Chloroflexota bacterium]
MSRDHDIIPLRDTEGAVSTDGFDRRMYDDMRRESPELAAAEQVNSKMLSTAPLLTRDLWASLYKANPKIRENLEHEPTLQIHQQLLNMANELDDWQDLRTACRLDQWSSALSAMTVSGRVLAAMPEETKQKLQEAADAQQQAQSLSNQALFNQEGAALAQQAGQEELSQELLNRAQQAQQQATQMQATAQAKAQEAQNGLGGKAVLQAVREASKDANETLENIKAFTWGTDPGQPQHLHNKNKFDLAWQVATSPKLKEIARLAGRIQSIARQKRRTRVKQTPTEIVDIETGDDLSNVLPSELVHLHHPVLKKDFLRRFAESNLMQYQLEGKEPTGRGPIVICLDSSGSMGGWREEWSKAVALALFQIAAQEKRAFTCIHFGSRDQLQVYKFPNPRTNSSKEIADMASFFFGGGTNFESPLKKAIEIIQESTFNKADIIFVTDGECRISGKFLNEFKKVKKEKEFSVISILMPGGVAEGVRPLSDKITWASKDEDEKALDEIFEF